VRRLLLSGIVASALVTLSPSAPGATGSGLYGTVSRGPVTPVCVAGRPCSRPAVGVPLVFVRTGAIAARVVTRTGGAYRLALRPGVYAVRLATPTRIGRGIEPATVRVTRARWSRQDFSIDTGIR
jgi:hypothetical protein